MSRRKVFQRDPRRVAAFQVTETDLLAVDDVGRFRLLLGEQLLQRRWPRPSQRRHGESRLRGLFHEQWLDRVPYQDGAARPRALYTLGKRGRSHLALKLGVPTTELGPRPAKERAHDALFLKHHLLTVQFIIHLELAATNGGAAVDKYEDERALKAARQKNRQEMPVIPDAFIVLTFNDRHQGFCVELDRATVDLRAWKRKLDGYWAWAKTESFANHYLSPAVLIVVGAEERLTIRRVAALKQLIEAEASTTRNDPSLFWLASLRDATIDGILREPIWAVGGQQRLFRLLPQE